jgi:hypothetical protein
LKEIPSWFSMTYYKNNWLISKYPQSERINVIDFKTFEQNRDDLVNKWIWYDLTISFFSNLEKIFRTIDFPTLNFYWVNENTDYSDQTFNSKNVYLSNTSILDCENLAYNFSVNTSSNVYNSLYVKDNCDIIYFSRWITKSFKIFYSSYIFDSNNIWFSSNLIWCSECIFCDNLENQSYCINNKKLDKQEYFKQKEEILRNKNKFEEYFSKIEKKWKNYWSENCSGNYVINSENIEKGWFVVSWKNWKNSFFAGWVIPNENFYDVFSAWWAWGNDFYWVIAAGRSDNLYSSTMIVDSSNIFYSYYLDNCSYCIW